MTNIVTNDKVGRTVVSSRVGRKPVDLPKGVEVVLSPQSVVVKGKLGQVTQFLPKGISVEHRDNQIHVSVDPKLPSGKALHGTFRALIANHVQGVLQGHVIKLNLVGVGYKAQASKKGAVYQIELQLGKSIVETYVAPEGVKIETPAVTEIVISGSDKAQVGQVAAEIYAHRKPDAYKGKGVRYANRVLSLKEVKKK